MSTDKRFPMRMHEQLGVEPGEEFGLDGYLSRYYVDIDGYVRSYESKEIMWGEQICDMINYPDRIIRRPRVTEEQLRELEALHTLGYRWIAKDESGLVCAFVSKPVRKCQDWAQPVSDDGRNKYIWLLFRLGINSLVSWSDPEPLDIVQTLKANGVEVEA
jgi:hypothetical protein